MVACLTIPALLSGLRCFAGPSWQAGPWRSRRRRGSKPSSARARRRRRAGVRPGMRLLRGAGHVPEPRAGRAGPGRRGGGVGSGAAAARGGGCAVEPVEPGCVFQTRGMERLAGGLGQALRRALDAVGPEWGRVWAQPPVASRRSPRRPWRRPVAPSSSTTARRTSSRSRSTSFRSPERREELGLGVKRLGSWHASPGPRSPIGSVRTARKHGGSLGGGRHLRRAAPSAGRAGGDAGVSGTGCERAHARAGTRGADRASARPPGAGRPGSQAARHLGEARRGGSWRSSLTLREPTAEPDRLRLALAPRLSELPAPTAELRLELGELTESVGTQTELVRPRGSRLRERLRGGMRQVRAAVGMDAVCTVVEVARGPASPSRAILVPRDD